MSSFMRWLRGKNRIMGSYFGPPRGNACQRIMKALGARPKGVPAEMLACWLRLSLGTVKKHLARMEQDALVVREIAGHRFVWRVRA